jgi:hypothetical protein
MPIGSCRRCRSRPRRVRRGTVEPLCEECYQQAREKVARELADEAATDARTRFRRITLARGEPPSDRAPERVAPVARAGARPLGGTAASPRPPRRCEAAGTGTRCISEDVRNRPREGDSLAHDEGRPWEAAGSVAPRRRPRELVPWRPSTGVGRCPPAGAAGGRALTRSAAPRLCPSGPRLAQLGNRLPVMVALSFPCVFSRLRGPLSHWRRRPRAGGRSRLCPRRSGRASA